MTAQIKVRVQRKAIVRLKALPRFPVSVAEGDGIAIDRSNGIYTFSVSNIGPGSVNGGVGASANSFFAGDGTWHDIYTQVPDLRERLYGAVANTNSQNAFTAFEATSYKVAYVNDALILNNIGALTKRYIGPGTLSDLLGNYAPGNFSRVLTPPTTAQTRTTGDAFNADLSHVSPEYWSFAAEATPPKPNAPYWNASIIPHYRFTNFVGGGSSGSYALLTTGASNGSTTITGVDTTTWAAAMMALPVAQRKLQFVEQGTYTADIVTLTAFGVGTITFTPALTQSYTTNNSQVGPGSRTQMNVMNDHANFNSAGDSYVWAGVIEAGYTPVAGQNNWQFTQTAGLFNGIITADQSGIYLQQSEFAIVDANHDIAAVGQVFTYQRENNTGANDALWVGQFHQSTGSKAADPNYVIKGKWKTGYDTTGATITGGRAFNMAIDQYVSFNGAQDLTLRYPIWGVNGGDTKIGYNSSHAALETYVAGTLVKQETAGGSVFVSNVLSAITLRNVAGGVVFVNGSNTTTLNVPSTAGTYAVTIQAANHTLVGRDTTDTLTNKTIVSPIITGAVAIADDVFQLVDNVDGTKKLSFQLSGIATATTRTWTVPDASDTFVGLTATQTLTNKTLTAPTMTAPVLGVATATSINKVAITAPATSATITIADGTTLTETTSTSIGRGQYQGTGTNDSATAGNIGEYVEGNLAQGSATALVNNTAKTVVSISLTAGDWDVSGSVGYVFGGTTTVTELDANISLTNNTYNGVAPYHSATQLYAAGFTPGVTAIPFLGTIPLRMSLASTTTVYLIAFASFGTSTASAFGTIRARRVR